MLIYRAGLALILTYSTLDAIRALRNPGDEWVLHGLARIPGMTQLARPAMRVLLAVLAVAGAVGFALEKAPLLSAALMTATFLVVTTLNHSVPWNGYSVETDDGRTVRQIYHHWHLPGLCAIAALASEIIVRIWDLPRGSVFLELEWAAIGAHYFVAGVSKMKRRGFGWVDRRLFPYYVCLLRSFSLGDEGKDTQPVISRAILRTPALGLAMLWVSLVCELGAVFYAFGTVPRLLIGFGLIGFHVMSSKILYITFNENLAVIVLFTFAGLTVAPAVGVGAIAFAVIVAISFAVGESLYPFSVLPMFTSPYSPQRVLLLTEEGGKPMPIPELVGGTTGGVSKELAVHLATGGTEVAFLDALERRMTAFARDRVPSRYRALIRTITVDDGGSVSVDESVFERTAPQ